MITYDELNTQTHEITELSNVLSYLFNDRGMCDTGTCCELFYRYGEKVEKHLDAVDHTYTTLLNSQDEHAKSVAHNFMGGSQEIKRIFGKYRKKWCQRHGKQLHVGDHDAFLRETGELFNLILNRVQDETEQLYPLIRTITGNAQHVA